MCAGDCLACWAVRLATLLDRAENVIGCWCVQCPDSPGS
jgi:hypothetical protein